MKKILFRMTIILPFVFLYFVTLKLNTAIMIPEVGLFLADKEVAVLGGMITFLLLSSPVRRACCDGTISELLYNLLPMEVLGVIIFSQWHFRLMVFLVIGFIVSSIVYGIMMLYAFQQARITRKRCRRYLTWFQKGIVVLAFMFFLHPAIRLPALRFGASGRTVVQELFYEPDSAGEVKRRVDLWKDLQEESWEKLNLPERLAIAKRLADFETARLGIPAVMVRAGKLKEYTRGQYDSTLNEITLNPEHLIKLCPEEMIEVVTHEAFHAQQYVIVKSIDWKDPASRAAYYKQAREWLNNMKSYTDMEEGGYEAYSSQVIEADARSYAEEETKKILSYIESVCSKDVLGGKP